MTGIRFYRRGEREEPILVLVHGSRLCQVRGQGQARFLEVWDTGCETGAGVRIDEGNHI